MTNAAKKLENWKSKAILRANEIRYLRRENIRLKNARDKYKAEANEAGKKLKEQDAAAKCPLWRVKSTLFSLPVNFSVSPALDSEPFPGSLAFLGAISGWKKPVSSDHRKLGEPIVHGAHRECCLPARKIGSRWLEMDDRYQLTLTPPLFAFP